MDLKPNTISIKTPRKRKRTRPEEHAVSVHYGDCHIPFHDPLALSILYQVIDEVQPDLVVDHGDLLDCVAISKFEKDPAHRMSLQDEINVATQHLGKIHALTPSAQHIFLQGNHEDRLRRAIWKESTKGDVGALLDLNAVKAQLDWGRLLGIGDLGWATAAYPDHCVLFDRLICTHGSTVRKWSGYSARAEYERYGKSGMSGHTHRRGVFEHRDYNGFHAWWELGMLGRIESRYTVYPDWQQGFAVVTWTPTDFQVEEVRIHNGRALYRGSIFEGHPSDFPF